MGLNLMGSMGSSANSKKTTVTNISQAGESTVIGGGQSMLSNLFLGRQARIGNLSLVGPTDQSRTINIEKAGATVPTLTGTTDSSATGMSGISVPHLLGLTWMQWGILGVVVIGLYWFYKRKKG